MMMTINREINLKPNTNYHKCSHIIISVHYVINANMRSHKCRFIIQYWTGWFIAKILINIRIWWISESPCLRCVPIGINLFFGQILSTSIWALKFWTLSLSLLHDLMYTHISVSFALVCVLCTDGAWNVSVFICDRYFLHDCHEHKTATKTTSIRFSCGNLCECMRYVNEEVFLLRKLIRKKIGFFCWPLIFETHGDIE